MNWLKQIFKQGLAHPFLLILYFIVYGVNIFRPEGNEWIEVSTLFLGMTICTVLLLFCVRFLFKNKINATIWLTITSFIILFFVPIHITLNYLISFPFKREWHSFLFLSLALIPLSVFLFFRKKTLTNVNQYLNILLIIFPLFEASQYAYSRFQMRNNETSIPTNGQAKKYNIYLIIPDGYASTQNLKKYWDFDNTPFVNYLKDKGFFIANNSRSNYKLTVLSVSSMLDLNYKQGVENAQWANIRAIEKNLTSRLLETNGYKYRMDIFNGKQLVSGKKRNLLSLYRCYFMQTALFKVGVWLSLYDLMDCEPISKFSTCVNLEKDLQIEEKYPRFLYTHTMFTHIPFTDTLSKTDNLEGMIEENKFITFLNDSFKITKALKDLGIEENNPLFGQYLFQIKRTNFWIKDTFDKFWQKIEKNSIVIVMSDHGSRFITGNSVEAKSEFYQNFTAVYFPDKDYTRLTDTITPINVMRMSINKAIGAELPYLLDKCIK